MNDRRCVVSFGKGYNFERGLIRLEQCVKDLGGGIPFFGFRDYPEGCPPHEVSPYAFKYFCIDECRRQGYTKILWLDTSVVINEVISDVFGLIETQGYFFVTNCASVGEYCHDKALATLGISRGEAFRLPDLEATNFGLNLEMEMPRKLLDEMMGLAVDGVTFPGSSFNVSGMSSTDSRVKGHRQDQPALSVLALRYGMNVLYSGSAWERWFLHDRDYVKAGAASTCVDVNMAFHD